MKCILHKLYCGQLAPAEHLGSNDCQYHNYLKKLNILHQQFESTLSPKQKKLFEEYLQYNSCANDYLQESAFRQGYQIGAQLILSIH